MKTRMPENTVQRILETLYEQRAQRLRPLKLDDILPSTPSVFWSSDPQSCVEIVGKLIEDYLAVYEDWWRELIQDGDFCLKAIRAKRDIITPLYSYDEELAKVSNRITLEFINKYSTLDYSIDWEKLVQFNSGKNSSP